MRSQAAKAAIFGCAMMLGASAALAGEPQAAPAFDEPPVAVETLEHAFWYCDYVATTEGVLATPMGACRFATEELKKVKFAGDFQALVQWWRSNKPAEHRKIAQALVD